MKKEGNMFSKGSTRRSFLKNGTVVGAATVGAGLLTGKSFAFEREDEVDRAPVTRGDIAILRFLQALEAVEEDLWRQYAELGGTQDNEFSGLTGGNAGCAQPPQLLYGGMPPYNHRHDHAERRHRPLSQDHPGSQGAEPFWR